MPHSHRFLPTPVFYRVNPCGSLAGLSLLWWILEEGWICQSLERLQPSSEEAGLSCFHSRPCPLMVSLVVAAGSLGFPASGWRLRVLTGGVESSVVEPNLLAWDALASMNRRPSS